MKILHISRTMGQGGAEKIVYQLCRDNHVHKQIVISSGGVYENDLMRLGIKHYTMPDIDKKNIVLMCKCFFKIMKVIKIEKVDIIHAHHRMAAFYTKLISIFTHIKRVYTAHNVFSDKKVLTCFALKGSCIVAVGEGVKQNLIETYGITEKDIRVIYNTVKIKKQGSRDEFLCHEKEKGKILIGNIGRITEQKGMDVFLYAIKKTIEIFPNVLGIIIGDGEEENKLKLLAQELSISKNIVFMGYRKDVLDIISQLDFVVLSSRWEGFPLTPIEVFSQGKTIIASDISGNNEIVRNEINGLLFKKEDYFELSEKMIYLIVNSKKRKKFETVAINTFENEFEYSKFIEAYNTIYAQIN